MLSRAFIVLFISMFVAMAGVGMVSPLLPVYVRDELGGPAIGVALCLILLTRPRGLLGETALVSRHVRAAQLGVVIVMMIVRTAPDAAGTK